jgi:hypothetical protein
MLAPHVLPQLLARNLLGLLQNKIIFFVSFEFYSKIALIKSLTLFRWIKLSFIVQNSPLLPIV